MKPLEEAEKRHITGVGIHSNFDMMNNQSEPKLKRFKRWCFVLVLCLWACITQAQEPVGPAPGPDCDHLRKKNEVYALRDGETRSLVEIWCDSNSSTAYTECMCDWAKKLKRWRDNMEKVKEKEKEVMKEFFKLQDESNESAQNASKINLNKSSDLEGDKAKAIALLEEAIKKEEASFKLRRDFYNYYYDKEIDSEVSELHEAQIGSFKHSISEIENYEEPREVSIVVPDDLEQEEAREEGAEGKTGEESTKADALKEEADYEEQQRRAREEEERVRQKEEEEERKRLERKAEYDERIEAQNTKNQQMAAVAAASTTSLLWYLGGFIYNGMGYPKDDRLYSGGNFYLGVRFGYTSGFFPYTANQEERSFDGSNYSSSRETVAKYGWTVNFNFNMDIGYESKYAGGYAFGYGEVGISPFILSAAGPHYGFGGRVFAGLKNVKLFAEYENGLRAHTTLLNLNTEITEYGHTKNFFNNIKLGIRVSWYGNPTTAYRNHLHLGIIEERIKNDEEGFYFQRLRDPYKPSILKEQEEPSGISGNITSATVRGYMCEWKHDNHGLLSVRVYPAYPFTGYIDGDRPSVDSGPLSDELTDGMAGFFIYVGYVRSIDMFGSLLDP